MATQPDTALIRKTVNEMQSAQHRTPSGQHAIDDECKQLVRLDKMETRMDKMDDRLSQGDLGFLDLRKDMATLAEKIGTLTKIIAAVGIAIGLGLLGTAGSALVWVIGQSAKGAP